MLLFLYVNQKSLSNIYVSSTSSSIGINKTLSWLSISIIGMKLVWIVIESKGKAIIGVLWEVLEQMVDKTWYKIREGTMKKDNLSNYIVDLWASRL